MAKKNPNPNDSPGQETESMPKAGSRKQLGNKPGLSFDNRDLNNRSSIMKESTQADSNRRRQTTKLTDFDDQGRRSGGLFDSAERM